MTNNLKCVFAKVTTTFYSYKTPHPYQVKTSNLVLPPTTLLMAIYRNLILLSGGDFCWESLKTYLKEKVVYAGFTIVPREGSDKVHFAKSALLLRLSRAGEGAGHKTDAMRREYVFTDGSYIGIFAFRGLEEDLVRRAVEYIDFLGNSESLVSVRVLGFADIEYADKADKDAFMGQSLSDDFSIFTQFGGIGLVERCGKITLWERNVEDILYVWFPLKPTGVLLGSETETFEPVRFGEIRGSLKGAGTFYCASLGDLEVVLPRINFEKFLVSEKEPRRGGRRGRGRRRRS